MNHAIATIGTASTTASAANTHECRELTPARPGRRPVSAPKRRAVARTGGGMGRQHGASGTSRV
jgi:hypothetical protein